MDRVFKPSALLDSLSEALKRLGGDLISDCPRVRREALMCGERGVDPKPSFTFHSLRSLQPPSPTLLSRNSHVQSFLLRSL
jgi:hypothetical protein